MVQSALPTGTVSNCWTLVGDSCAHLVVDDPVCCPDDCCTYAHTTTDCATFRVNIGSLCDPVSATCHTVTARGRATGAGGVENIRIKIFEGCTQRACSGNIALLRSACTWRTETYTLTACEANSITAYCNLRIDIIAFNVGMCDDFFITQTFFQVPCPVCCPGQDFPLIVNPSAII